jgi:hypothetical protein
MCSFQYFTFPPPGAPKITNVVVWSSVVICDFCKGKGLWTTLETPFNKVCFISEYGSKGKAFDKNDYGIIPVFFLICTN